MRHGTVDRPATAARKLTELLQGSDGVAAVDSDEDIPRGTTGKVDVAELKEMLATQQEAQR